MPLQQIITTWFALNGSNDETASGVADLRTGAPLFVGGLNIGDYFDVTEQEANEHSWDDIGILHSGRYRRVQVHANATAANVTRGKIGFMVTSLIPEVNIVTSADAAAGGLFGVRPVVFLNQVTPGKYCFIQELGVASMLMVTAGGAIGANVGVPSGSTDGTITSAGTPVIGQLLDAGAANTQVRVLMNGVPIIQG